MLPKKIAPGLNLLAEEVYSNALCIHKRCGQGLNNIVYQPCLYNVLKDKGYNFHLGYCYSLKFDGKFFQKGFTVDLLLDNQLIITITSKSPLGLTIVKSMVTYLKYSNIKLRIIINFHYPLLKQGFKRVIYTK